MTRPEMCPELMRKTDEVVEAILLTGDSKVGQRYHRRCSSDRCSSDNPNFVDVYGERRPVDNRWPDRIPIILEISGLESCTYEPEDDSPSGV